MMTQCSGSQSDESGTSPCPRCRALEAHIAALEARLAARGDAEAHPDPAPEPRGRGDSDVDTGPGAEIQAPPGPKPSTLSSIDLPPLEFKALRLIPYGWGEGWQLRPSPPRRHWMDESTYSYQCLPLVIANQWGWQILCPTDVRVTWDGTPGLTGLRIEVAPQYEPAIKSQFGSGIVTFSPPWLFRTPPGWDLYLKGPSNRWKPNCAPLEGVVETWWLNYTFTLNWKLVEPGTVVFARGESLGQLVPVPHATFEDASALEAPIGLIEPDAARELVQWLERRRQLAGQKVNVHHLYRKAEGIEEHLQRVKVPPIKSSIP
jgi:Family of unknown function (DUF6065)